MYTELEVQLLSKCTDLMAVSREKFKDYNAQELLNIERGANLVLSTIQQHAALRGIQIEKELTAKAAADKAAVAKGAEPLEPKKDDDSLPWDDPANAKALMARAAAAGAAGADRRTAPRKGRCLTPSIPL